MENDPRLKKTQKFATGITLVCIFANFPLLAFILFGPNEGMEELAILIPWLLTGFINIILVIPALTLTLHSRRHLANTWIYLYFIVFFGFHTIYLIQVNGIDTRLYQKFTAVWNPDQAEFHKLLTELRHIPSDDKTARVEELIRNGVDVNSMYPGDRQTALQKAGFGGDTRVIELLLKKGAAVDGIPLEPITALGWAVQQNHTQAVRLLLAHGAEPNRGVAGYSFLNYAIRNQNAEIVAALLKGGADPNKRIHRPELPLMVAASMGNHEIVKLLLEAGADPDYMLPNGQTALVVAVQRGHAECVGVLLAAGAKLIGSGFSGKGLLTLAATGENQEIVAMIKKAAQSEMRPDSDGKFSFRNRYFDLNKALRENRIDDFKKMILIGISPDSTTDRGTTLLQGICMKSLGTLVQRLDVIDTVRFLVENGADINRPSSDGTTPLMNAAWTGQIDLVRLLIKSGAHIHAVNKSGHNALYSAMTKGREEIIDVLLSAGVEQIQ
ncbi:MAG: ankyrin repeat domain-containing protein [Desulfobulbaceae bacterium]|nr:ankyrin repeat domain-containing protein [Desulfobulbaceae bacterium]